MSRFLLVFSLLALALAILVGYSVTLGAAKISPVAVYRAIFCDLSRLCESGLDHRYSYIVLNIRLPRVLGAVVAGFSLAVAGAVLQAVFRNPLVSEYTIGLASAASFGASLAIIAGAGFISRYPYVPVITDPWVVVVNSFVFCIATASVISGIARLRGSNPVTVILAGISISYLFSAGTSILQYLSGAEALKAVIIWLLGDLSRTSWEYLRWMSLSLLFIPVLIYNSWRINAISIGEESAETLGINVKALRAVCIIIASAMSALTISFVGVIGFVGLISPHIARLAIGSNVQRLIPISGLVGAVLLLLSDTVARTAVAPLELPVGAITSSLGAPFFLYLLIRSRRYAWV